MKSNSATSTLGRARPNQQRSLNKSSSANGARRAKRGMAAVEMAFVLPLFVMLVFGIVEFGRAMMCMQVLINTAREGARACAVSPLTTSEVQQICVEYAHGGGVPGVTVTVTPDPTTVMRGEPVTVTVSVNFADVAFVPPFYAKNTTLVSKSTMRKEREFD